MRLRGSASWPQVEEFGLNLAGVRSINKIRRVIRDQVLYQGEGQAAFEQGRGVVRAVPCYSSARRDGRALPLCQRGGLSVMLDRFWGRGDPASELQKCLLLMSTVPAIG